jgi:signal transduction histidine kinase
MRRGVGGGDSFGHRGRHLPPQDLGRVFERFYQADRSRHRKAGVGLELSTARQVVRLHGGEISAESAVGRGSRFTIRLPAQGKKP